MNRLAILGLLLALATGARGAGAQVLSFDPGTGNYRLQYRSAELDRDIAIEVEPPNKIAPRFSLEGVERLPDGRYAYKFVLENGTASGSTQPIIDIEITCPGPGRVAVGAPQSWSAVVAAGGRRTDGMPYCRFMNDSARDGVAPGDRSGGFTLVTTWLPGVTAARAWGLAEPVQFPAEETEEHDPRLHDLLATVNGVRGGWVEAPAVAPLRDPSVATPAEMLGDWLSADLAAACGELGWIDHQGTCNSLRTKLDQAARSLERGRATAALGQLRSFLLELEAQHGPEPGKHVTDYAYWLLRVSGEHLLSIL